MSNISEWSTTAASNNSASPDGFPEGMAPSGVNDSAREVMAAVRTWYENAQWIDLGHTATFASATSVTIATDLTATYTVNRRVRLVAATPGTIYGTILTSTFSSPNTTLTFAFDSGSLSNEVITSISPSLLDTNTATGLAKVETKAASASATIDFDDLAAGYDYEITFDDVLPATSETELGLRLAVSGTYQTGGTDYSYVGISFHVGDSVRSQDSDGDDRILMMNTNSDAGIDAAETIGGKVTIINPAGGNVKVLFTLAYQGHNNNWTTMHGTGTLDSGVVDGVRFLFSSGNIAQGNFTLRAIKR